MVPKNQKLSSLSVFFPCYNEAANIPSLVSAALVVLPEVAKKFEILIIDDGSTDTTQRVVQRLAEKHTEIRLISHQANEGYGATVKTGLRSAQYQWVFFTDGDGQFSLKQLADLIQHTAQSNVIIGYRTNRAEGWRRHLNATLYRWLINVLFQLFVRDIDCAFKLMRRRSIENLVLKSNGAFLSAELLLRLRRKGEKIIEVPVQHYPRKRGNATGAKLSVIVGALIDAFTFRASTLQ